MTRDWNCGWVHILTGMLYVHKQTIAGLYSCGAINTSFSTQVALPSVCKEERIWQLILSTTWPCTQAMMHWSMSAEYEYNGMGLGSRGEAIFDHMVLQYFEKIACWIPILCELNPTMDLIIPGWNRVWNIDMRSYFSLLVGFRCFQPTCERLWGRLWCLLLPRWNFYIWSGCRAGAWTT